MALLPCRFKLGASFHSHLWIQTKVTVRKLSNWVKIGDSLSRVTLKFDGWPWETVGHLFCVASSLMHHFIAIGEFKVKLQSGNAEFRSISAICVLIIWRMTLKMTGQFFYATSSFVHHSVAIGDFKLELYSGSAQFGSKYTIFSPLDLEIWRMTLKNKRAPLLSKSGKG